MTYCRRRAWFGGIMNPMDLFPMRTLKGATIVALLALVACGGDHPASTEPPVSTSIIAGSVTATRVAGGVAISNGTERAIGYAVWNPNWLGLFAPCSDPSPTCLRLKPGGLVDGAARRDRRLERADHRRGGVLVAGAARRARAAIRRARSDECRSRCASSLYRSSCARLASPRPSPGFFAAATGALFARGMPTPA